MGLGSGGFRSNVQVVGGWLFKFLNLNDDEDSPSGGVWNDGSWVGPVRDNGGQVFNVKNPRFGDGGAKGDGVTDDATAINTALAAAGGTGKPVVLVGGTYLVNSPLNATSDIVIEVVGEVTIRAGASMTHLFKHDGTCRIRGGKLTLDGNGNVTYGVFHSTNYFPDIEGVHTIDGTVGFNTGSTVTSIQSHDTEGDGQYIDCEAESATNYGFNVRGDTSVALGSRTSRIRFENCRTSGSTCGRDGRLVMCAHVGIVEWIGGDFTGNSAALCTNAYACDQATILGGYYHDIARGATVGENTKRFVIKGVASRSVSLNAVSADTTDGVDDTVGIGTIEGCVADACGRAVRTTCSHVSVIGNRAYDCTDTTGIFAFAGEGSDVFADGNVAYRSAADAFVAFIATEGTTVRMGRNNWHNSTARNAVQAAAPAGNKVVPGNGDVRVITADYDVKLSDRILIVDCTSNSVDLDLPDGATMLTEGWDLEIVKIDATNNLTISVQGADGTVNGQPLVFLNKKHQYRSVRVYAAAPSGEDNVFYVTGLKPMNSISDDKGDASSTAAPDGSEDTLYYNTPLTTNRTLTLSTTDAVVGNRFRVVRSASATGGSTLSVGGLKSLAAGEWCDVEYNGSAWVLTACGAL